MKNAKVRQSNFELMRIISMLFIVVWHFLVHGGIWPGTHGVTNNLCTLLAALFLVHVDSFVLLTGYFNYDKEFKLSKIIKLNNQMWFYRVIILIIFIFGLSFSFTKLDIFHMVSPIPRFSDYWFIVTYMILYLISPILNMIIRNSDKEKHKKIIIALLLINILAFFTHNEFFNINSGYSLFSFILLYFIGSYMHKYPIEKSNMYKSFSKNKLIVYSLCLYLFLSIFNMLLYYFGNSLNYSTNSLVRYYMTVITDGFVSYSNPVTILATISYFIFFSKLEIKSRVINFFGRNILGVYLITENLIVRGWMYKFLGFGPKVFSIKHLLIAIGYSIGIIIVCTLVEALRSLIFKFFYKRKVSSKLREKIQLFLKSLDINVNW